MARRKKQNDEAQENKENINNESDDTFGLPEVEYEPLKRDEPSVEPDPVQEPEPEPVSQSRYEPPFETQEEIHREEEIHNEELVEEEAPHQYRSAYSYMEEDRNPAWPKVLGIILVLLVAAGAVYYFAFHLPEENKRKAQLEQQERSRRIAAKEESDRKYAEDLKRQAEQRRLDSLASIPKTGTMERLTGRTGRYYVVVASAIDDDLLTDFANQLVNKGTSVKIIPPFGKTKFHRLAIDSKDSYVDAQATADGMKGGDFGDQLWVVRY